MSKIIIITDGKKKTINYDGEFRQLTIKKNMFRKWIIEIESISGQYLTDASQEIEFNESTKIEFK